MEHNFIFKNIIGKSMVTPADICAKNNKTALPF